MKDVPTSGNLLARRLRMVLLHLAEEACRDLDLIPTKPVRGIHSLRTRMKNLRAILRLVRERVPKVSRKAIVASCKALKAPFSELRDAHVLAALRAEVGWRGRAWRQPARTPARVVVSSRTLAAGSRLVELLGKLRLDGLVWADVLGAYVRCYRDGRKGLKACRRDPGPKLLHAWRRPVKDFFYQSRVLQPLDGMTRRVRLAQRLGERLGRWHDLQLFADHPRGDEKHALGKRIAREQKAIEPLIFKTAGKLFSDKPGKIAKALEQCVRMLPAVAANCARQA